MVRSMAEWAKHPQGMAIASLPLLEIVKIGDAPVEKLPQGELPLSGVRVLDLTRVLAGPTCARTLAEHGADVLKITAPHLPNIGYQEFDTGHGKLSTHLDLRQPKDLAILRDLVREGGSWLVRISLAQTGRWLVDRGEVPETALTDVPKEFAAEELARWSTTSDTPVGRLAHLKPVVQMSETAPFWARPSVPLGHNE